MSYQPFYITQYEDETGFENYFESFLLPEKAFPILEDAYCWRGRVIKRGGTFLLGRLNRNLVDITLTIQASGGSYVVADLLAASPINARGAFAVTQETNAEIDAGTLKITVGALTFTDNGAGVLTSSGEYRDYKLHHRRPFPDIFPCSRRGDQRRRDLQLFSRSSCHGASKIHYSRR